MRGWTPGERPLAPSTPRGGACAPFPLSREQASHAQAILLRGQAFASVLQRPLAFDFGRRPAVH